jgi:hypothetical protein
VARRAVAWGLRWAAFWWAFDFLAGDWNRIEWIAAACAATVGATLAEGARALAGVRLGLPLERLMHVPSALAMVFVDFGILVAALVRSLARRKVVRGRFVAREHEPGGSQHDAWTVLVAGLSPNAYVVDVDEERDVVLLHDLVARRSSEQPA